MSAAYPQSCREIDPDFAFEIAAEIITEFGETNAPILGTPDCMLFLNGSGQDGCCYLRIQTSKRIVDFGLWAEGWKPAGDRVDVDPSATERVAVLERLIDHVERALSAGRGNRPGTLATRKLVSAAGDAAVNLNLDISAALRPAWNLPPEHGRRVAVINFRSFLPSPALNPEESQHGQSQTQIV